METRSRWGWVLGLGLGSGLLVISLAGAAPAAVSAAGAVNASVITVTTTVDEFDTPPGGNGQCSLREAIEAISLTAAFGGCNAGAPGDTILLAAGATYTLTQTGGLSDEDANVSGDLDPAVAMTIRPASGRATITAAGLGDRVFDIQPGGQVVLSDLTLTGGDVTVLAESYGGAIRNTGVLILAHMDVYGNQANYGGGIYNVSVVGVALDITDSNVYSNSAFSYGGGLLNSAHATLIDSAVVSNTAGASLFSGGFAGGLYNEDTLVLRNVTVSGNTAGQGGGGGLYNIGMATLNNVTLTNNHVYQGGGGLSNSGNGLQLANSVIAGNESVVPQGLDCFGPAGPLNSTGYNLLGTFGAGSCTVKGVLTSVITTTTPLLGALGLYGGRTYTHALLAGSPALDHGNPAAPASGWTCELADQRGVARIGRCDVGAYDAAQWSRLFLPWLRQS